MFCAEHAVITRWLILATLAGSIGVGCSSTVTPDNQRAQPRDVVVTTGTTPDGRLDGLLMVDASRGRIITRIDLGGMVEGLASAPDGNVLYGGVVDAAGRRTLVAVDGKTGRPLWTLPLSDYGTPTVVDGIALFTAEVVASSPDNRLVYAARALRDSIGGIVALDATTRRPVAFSGPWNVAAGGLVPLGSDPAVPLLRDGALAVVASRQSPAGGGRRSRAGVYLLAPTTLAVLDSILPSALRGSPMQDIWQVVAAPDARSVYVAGSEQIVRYDLAARRITASIARPSVGGAVTVTADGSAVIIADAGRWPDTPGSGLLFLYSSDLLARGVVDVTTPLGGTPRTSSAMVTGVGVSQRAGHVLYIRAGTPAIGPLFPSQPARLLIVDVQEKQLLRAVDLGGYGLGPVVLGSP